MPTYDYLCKKCNKEFEVVEKMSEHKTEIKCECGGVARTLIKTAPAVHGCDSFNPHYDNQMDKWFESADHKKAWLKEKGYKQLDGPLSPRKQTRDEVFCSKGTGTSMETHKD